ncbi:NINE protein [Fulvivirga lutea]|uniref:TM2 domain-containing protein n=1 Tax=Fulvivirga lutea TaxID=2810512 RepID=A0A974WF85_9BACT|nr:TM2 domain-containing protein [Fulvivirga lutea]QSE95992.1 TM2 domain-containing protein [Fulvivirga lutea]
MKKVLLLTMLMAFIASANSFASANKYKVDEAAIDQVFESSINVVSAESDINMMDITSVKAANDDKNVWVALLLDWVLGGLAIHRVYLGGRPVLIVGYLLTCGGIFGLLPLGDFIALLINMKDISKYVDNDAFIMW